jgi:hypothetical protein
MLMFLWRLIVVGFPPKKPDCEHNFGNWEVVNVMGDNYGSKKVFQMRRCTKCGLTASKVETVG